MFKGGKMDPDEVGIMSILMGEDDDMGEDEDESDMGKLMDRRPDSPEILMNNLRGDVRSIDARFEELADMVGYDAAQQTPPEVLALLQPVLAAEQQGIAALPAMAPGAAPAAIPTPPPPMAAPAGPGLPPGAAPPEAAGIGSLPMGMAKGGPVIRRFSNGTPPEGVTGEGDERADQRQPSFSTTQLQQRLGEKGFGQVLKDFQASQTPVVVPSLETATAARIPQYERLLGQDKSLTQAQMLFDIAGAGLALAGNVDPRTGQPLRGSLAARIAGAASQLPAQIGARASEAEKMAQQIKLLGIQAAEKEIERKSTQEAARAKTSVDLIKEAMRGDFKLQAEREKLAAKGVDYTKMSNFDIMNLLMPGFIRGNLTPDQLLAMQNAVTDYIQPVETEVTDKLGNKSRITQRKDLPETFVQGYINTFGREAYNKWFNGLPNNANIRISQVSFPSLEPRPTDRTRAGTVGAPAATTGAPVTPVTPVAIPVQHVTPSSSTPAAPAAGADMRRIAPYYNPSTPGIFQSRTYLTGPLQTAIGLGGRYLPSEAVGEAARAQQNAREDAMTLNANLIEALSINADGGRISEGERTALKGLIGLEPRFFSSDESMATTMIRHQKELMNRLESARRIMNNEKDYTANVVVDARKKAGIIEDYLRRLNVPPVVNNENDLKAIPAGQEYIWNINPVKPLILMRGSPREQYPSAPIFENMTPEQAARNTTWNNFKRRSSEGTVYGIRQRDGNIQYFKLQKGAAEAKPATSPAPTTSGRRSDSSDVADFPRGLSLEEDRERMAREGLR